MSLIKDNEIVVELKMDNILYKFYDKWVGYGDRQTQTSKTMYKKNLPLLIKGYIQSREPILLLRIITKMIDKQSTSIDNTNEILEAINKEITGSRICQDSEKEQINMLVSEAKNVAHTKHTENISILMSELDLYRFKNPVFGIVDCPFNWGEYLPKIKFKDFYIITNLIALCPPRETSKHWLDVIDKQYAWLEYIIKYHVNNEYIENIPFQRYKKNGNKLHIGWYKLNDKINYVIDNVVNRVRACYKRKGILVLPFTYEKINPHECIIIINFQTKEILCSNHEELPMQFIEHMKDTIYVEKSGIEEKFLKDFSVYSQGKDILYVTMLIHLYLLNYKEHSLDEIIDYLNKISKESNLAKRYDYLTKQIIPAKLTNLDIQLEPIKGEKDLNNVTKDLVQEYNSFYDSDKGKSYAKIMLAIRDDWKNNSYADWSDEVSEYDKYSDQTGEDTLSNTKTQEKLNYYHNRLSALNKQRQKVLNEILKPMALYLDCEILDPPGSKNLKSDLDITITKGPTSKVVFYFNTKFEKLFGKSSSEVYDMNIYGRNYFTEKNISSLQNCTAMSLDPKKNKILYYCCVKTPSYIRDQHIWAFIKLLQYVDKKSVIDHINRINCPDFESNKQMLLQLVEDADVKKTELESNKSFNISEQNIKFAASLREIEKMENENMKKKSQDIDDETRVKYLNKLAKSAYYAQDAYYTIGALGDVFVKQQQKIDFKCSQNEFVDSFLENIANLHKIFKTCSQPNLLNGSKYSKRVQDSLAELKKTTSSCFKTCENTDMEELKKEVDSIFKIRGKENFDIEEQTALDKLITNKTKRKCAETKEDYCKQISSLLLGWGLKFLLTLL